MVALFPRPESPTAFVNKVLHNLNNRGIYNSMCHRLINDVPSTIELAIDS